MTDKVLIVGLDPEESTPIKERAGRPCLIHSMLPRIKVERGRLFAERTHVMAFTEVHEVVFHGIFEDDFDFICGLALWGGPVLPDARAMMDCRLKLPCLIRASRASRFGEALRGFATADIEVNADRETVAKWGNWHCGENKARFVGSYTAGETTSFEPFFHGEAVRVVVVGDRCWQIHLRGEDWLKSIHHADAAFMPVDPALLEDTRGLMAHFGLAFIGVDYIVADDGQKHLLEVNHIPSITCFPEIRQAYLDLAVDWLSSPKAGSG